MVDVIAVLRQQKLTAAKRSVAFSETQEKRVVSTAERATAVVNGTSPFAGSEHFAEYQLRDLYMRTLESYERKPLYSYYGQPFTPHGLALWKRVRKAVEDSGVDSETFIKAQFTFYHNTFKTAPKPHVLTTDAAVLRASVVKPEKVSTNNVPANVGTVELFKRCERQMNDVMRAQGLTREDVYRKLVLTRLIAFPDIYLNADPVWRKMTGK